MIYQILNGDSLAYSFPNTIFDGEIVVTREALMDGDLSGDNLDDFWQSRANFLRVPEATYRSSVVKEFEKLMNAPNPSDFNLWFEYDLFCQVNMWFVLSLIRRLPIEKKVYAVYTTHLTKTDKTFWNGFGPAQPNELEFCYANRVPLSEADLQFGQELWMAFKNGKLAELTSLSTYQSSAFPYLPEVVEAHVDRFPKDGEKGRPERVIEEIIRNGSSDFGQVFREFWNRESIYGFGDVQLKRLYEMVINSR